MTSTGPVAGAESRNLVLGAAGEVFYARGVAGAGMLDIRDAAGVSLRRLYGLYPSKRSLVAAWLSERHETWMSWLRGTVEAKVSGGVSAIDALFDTLGEWAASPGYRGCAFLNTAAEVSEIDDAHRAIIAGHKRSLVAYLGALFPGQLPGDPEVLGVLVDGALVQSAVFASVAPIEAARSAAKLLFEGRR